MSHRACNEFLCLGEETKFGKGNDSSSATHTLGRETNSGLFVKHLS